MEVETEDQPLQDVKCSYPDCKGFPRPMLEPCPKCKGCNFVHHLCQIEYEMAKNVEGDVQMGKRCFVCETALLENLTTNVESVNVPIEGAHGIDTQKHVPIEGAHGIIDKQKHVPVEGVCGIDTQEKDVPIKGANEIDTKGKHFPVEGAYGIDTQEKYVSIKGASGTRKDIPIKGAHGIDMQEKDVPIEGEGDSEFDTQEKDVHIEGDAGDGNIRKSAEDVELGSIGELSAVTADEPDYDANKSVQRNEDVPPPPPSANTNVAATILPTIREVAPIRRGKNLPELIIPDNENDCTRLLPEQKGFKGNSIVLGPQLYCYTDQDLMQSYVEDFTEKFGPYMYGKIIEVPNKKKNIPYYTVQYDKTKLLPSLDVASCCCKFPSTGDVKILLKRAIARANIIDYRFKGNMNRRKKQTTSSTMSEIVDENTVVAEVVGDDSVNKEGSVLLAGILTVGNNNSGTGNDENGSSDEDSESDEGSQCDVETSAFFDPRNDSIDEQEPNLRNTEEEINYMTNDWLWNKWEAIGNNDEVQGPIENDHYNGDHGLKPGVGNSFQTVLQCIFITTPLNCAFFKRLATQSNKYVRADMNSRNSNKFLGHEWKNISTAEMIRFFGILLRISLEPRKMGGYTTYFSDESVIAMGSTYRCKLRGYEPWAKRIMTLVRFKQIRSAFHPETGTSLCGDKCHQLRYIIRMFNDVAKKTFHLGPDVAFDEGGVAMRSRYCPVRQYNKDKPDKYRVDFFILADARYYNVGHLDVYQGKKKPIILNIFIYTILLIKHVCIFWRALLLVI